VLFGADGRICDVPCNASKNFYNIIVSEVNLNSKQLIRPDRMDFEECENQENNNIKKKYKEIKLWQTYK
jgi:hypothetical protein